MTAALRSMAVAAAVGFGATVGLCASVGALIVWLDHHHPIAQAQRATRQATRGTR